MTTAPGAAQRLRQPIQAAAAKLAARRRTTTFGRTRQVVIIGANAQVLPTAGLFVGGGILVQVFTHDTLVEEQLAPYPGVTVSIIDAGIPRRLPTFRTVPTSSASITMTAPDCARLAAEHAASSIWQPERRGKTPAAGFLSLGLEPQSQSRKRLLKRLQIPWSSDRLMSLAGGAGTAGHPHVWRP